MNQKSIYQKKGEQRIYIGFIAVLLIYLLRLIGIIPAWICGTAGLCLVPYIIINAAVIEHQESKHSIE